MEKKYVIAVGTTSKQKLCFVESILEQMKLNYTLVPIEVESGVSEQPLSSDETRKGSLNRAKNALFQCSMADFALGIEIGYQLNQNEMYEVHCWTSIVDTKGNEISQASHYFLLPTYHQQILLENKALGDYVGRYVEQNQNDPMKFFLGRLLQDREVFIHTATREALIQYLMRSEYL